MPNDLDILREVGSIASGHGSTALSEMLGRKVNLEFPAVDIITSLEVPSKIKVEKLAVAVFCKIIVGLDGEVALLLDGDNASKLINLSYRIRKDEESQPGFITDMGVSVLKEVGNIIVGAYLNALSMMLNRLIIPPIPTLMSGSIEDILNTILLRHRDMDYCYLIESVFEEPESKLTGGFFLILSPYTARDIKKSCDKILTDMEK